MTNEVQEALASQFGLIYKSLYFVEYRDPNYPCRCPCHTPGSTVLHCFPCCHDNSYQRVLMYSGVYHEPDRDGHKSRGKYFLFTDPNPEVQKFRDEYYSTKSAMSADTTMVEMNELEEKRRKIKNIETYLWFDRLDRYTITPHRRSWDKLPKNRHNPVDLPLDLSHIRQ
jgi:hypothetical protein